MARRAVGADDHIRSYACFERPGGDDSDEPADPAVVADGFVGAADKELHARRDRGALQRRVEQRSLHDDPVAGIGAPGRSGQPDPIAGRTDDDHVADPLRVRQVEPQLVQQLHAAWPDEVSACLVSRERDLVDECDPRAASANTSAATLPAGPDPTTSTSKR